MLQPSIRVHDGKLITMREILLPTVLIYLTAVCCVAYAAPTNGKSSTLSARKSTQREANKKSVDAEQLRRLLQQRILKRRLSSFDDEDPLHILLGSATKPRKSTLQVFTKTTKSAKDQPRQRLARFMEAIGLAPGSAWGLGSSSSSDDHWGLGSSSEDQWYGGASRYSYDEDDSDDDDDYDEYSGMQKN